MHVDLQPVDRMPSVLVPGMKGNANVLMVISEILFVHAESVSILIFSSKHVYSFSLIE